jgi:DNA-binding winged helix-turn-helix (wHTH) protein
MSLSLNDLYRFDEFELSRSRRTLLRNGEAVPLLPRTFEVLACLVENPGRVLTKQEILKIVWPESFVEENNLSQHISFLRKALANRASLIATLPGRGYQFTASVVVEPGAANGAAPNGSGIRTTQPANGRVPQTNGLIEDGSAASTLAGAPARKPQARIQSFFTQLLRRMAR